MTMKPVIFIINSGGEKGILLYDYALPKEESLLGGWFNEGFMHAAEALKVALPHAEIRYYPCDEDAALELWSTVKTTLPADIKAALAPPSDS